VYVVPQLLDLSTGGLYLSDSGSVVGVVCISPEQKVFLGNDQRVYTARGRYLRPQDRMRRKIDPKDLIRAASSLAPGEASADIHFAVCRCTFLSSPAYHALIEMAETSGVSHQHVAFFVDRFLSEHSTFSRFRHALVTVMRNHMEAFHDL
jgi:hypothetical protein